MTSFLLKVVVGVALAVVGADAQTLGFGKTNIERFNGHGNGHFLNAASFEGDNDVTTHFFKGAVVDNFAQVDGMKPWFSGQRYFENKKFWKGPPAPIFLFIGGEGAESARHVSNHTYMYKLAEQHGALMLDLEHRFYGESAPFETTDTVNLAYLTSEQALADLARFISNYTIEAKAEGSPVVAFGGSYPGNLAAWVRLKYPHLIAGSISSSAPVTAVANFEGYMEVVGDALRWWGGAACYDAVQAGAAALQTLLDQAKYSQVEADLKLCGPLGGDSSHANASAVQLDIWQMQSNLMGSFQGTVQYNNQAPVMNVTDVCAVMLNGTDPYAQLLQANHRYLAEGGLECLDQDYPQMVAALRNSSWASDARAARMWTYQTCNEFGYFQTTSSSKQPFHSWTALSLQSYLDLCEEVYSIPTPPFTAWTNAQYGATTVRNTEVAFVQGSLDPWHVLGVTNTTALPAADESVFIAATSHCADMAYAPTPSAAMTAGQKTISEAVGIWVAGGSIAPQPANGGGSGSGGMAGGPVAGLVIMGFVVGGVLVGLAWRHEAKQRAARERDMGGYDPLNTDVEYVEGEYRYVGGAGSASS